MSIFSRWGFLRDFFVSALSFSTRVLLLFCFLISSQLLADIPSVADWVLVDNFESENALSSWVRKDTRNDTQPYVKNPQITEIRSMPPGQGPLTAEKASTLGKKEPIIDRPTNQFLIKKPAAEGVVGNRKALTFKKLPTVVGVGDVYTFYTRFNVEYFPNNHVFGLSNLDAKGIIENDYNAFEPSLRITDKTESDGTKNDGTLMVKKGHSYAKINNPKANRVAQPLEPGIWYEAWYVVNNAKRKAGGQRYDVYLKGGEFKTQTQVYDGADFRMQREQPLGYFLMNCNTGPADKPYGNGGIRYDDIYMVKGLSLSVPAYE